jgi:hypothetical protein
MKSRASSDNVLGIFGGIPLPILSKACVYMVQEKIVSHTVTTSDLRKSQDANTGSGSVVCMHFMFS